MEKQLCNAAYWIGLISSVLALITRGFAVLGIFVFPVTSSGKIPLSYRSFLDGAMLFFVMAIASSVTMWAKAQKS
jgi:flagellar biosynthesis protein FliR